MIKKIEEEGDISNLKAGMVLIKYPLSGEFSEEVKFDDNSNLLHYEIHTINPQTEMLELKIPVQNFPAGEMISGISNQPPVIIKPLHELITDKTWWYEQ